MSDPIPPEELAALDALHEAAKSGSLERVIDFKVAVRAAYPRLRAALREKDLQCTLLRAAMESAPAVTAAVRVALGERDAAQSRVKALEGALAKTTGILRALYTADTAEHDDIVLCGDMRAAIRIAIDEARAACAAAQEENDV